MSKINAISFLTASFRSDLLINKYSNNKGSDKIYCLNDEKRFVSVLRVRFSQSASADGSHRPCRHPHLQVLSKLVTRICVPKYMKRHQWQLQVFFFPSLNTKTFLTPLEKYIFSSCSFQKFSKQKTSSFYTNNVITHTVNEVNQICSLCWFNTLHDRETNWKKKLILSTTYDNKHMSYLEFFGWVIWQRLWL